MSPGEAAQAMQAMQPIEEDEFSGGVVDTSGVFHTWELDIEKIRRLTAGGSIPEIYRLVA
jgi:hypothetical protein